MRTLMIDPVLNGFIIKCGCQKVVFNSLDAMVKEIYRYFKNPEQVEKEYVENAINHSMQTELQRPEGFTLDLRGTQGTNA